MAASKTAASKKGYLKYKGGCGAVIKVPMNDLFHALAYQLTEHLRPRTHRCDDTHVCVAHLIGGTFEEKQDPE